MTNQEASNRTANRRAALGTAARYLSDSSITFPDYAAWAQEVTSLADRLLPWLAQDLGAARDR